jgi:hypothetical protein
MITALIITVKFFRKAISKAVWIFVQKAYAASSQLYESLITQKPVTTAVNEP